MLQLSYVVNPQIEKLEKKKLKLKLIVVGIPCINILITNLLRLQTLKKHLDQEGTAGILSSKRLLLMKLLKTEDVGSSSSSSKKSFSSDLGVEHVMRFG